MLWLLLLIPAAAAIVALALTPAALRRTLLPAAAAAHAALTAMCWVERPEPVLNGWLGLDDAALLVLSVTSALFLAAASYATGYLRHEPPRKTDFLEGGPFTDAPEARFVACLLLFLATMTLVALSRHLGLLWVGVEATTLASAPLIYFHRHHRSLEATWKYLLICSVGIALALQGNFFLAVAAKGSREVHLTIDHLQAHAGQLDPVWLKAAFLFLLVGYGTKMGLAPMHTWLPDAHSEAPSVVSALLSGALLNCAFLGILRIHALMGAAGLGEFSGGLLTGFGLLSMAVAAVFIIEQADYKRMLAYSSVEHMGILALGAGLGGLAGMGAMLHMVNHSLAKGMMFLLAGNVLAVYRTKSAPQVRGLLQVLPVTGPLWLAGFLAIAGSPPFGLFVSELLILKGALQQGHTAVAAGYLLLLGVAFAAMARIVLRMAYGSPAGIAVEPERSRGAWAVVPPLALGAVVLTLGLCLPDWLRSALTSAAAAAGVR
ncbi:MAG TPA: proton-conducting transporter membrane subunit [Desulfobacterales bacterium]|nr:proton-conducting transporter membrane subunit [Desulfobacterales bacterium]